MTAADLLPRVHMDPAAMVGCRHAQQDCSCPPGGLLWELQDLTVCQVISIC